MKHIFLVLGLFMSLPLLSQNPFYSNFLITIEGDTIPAENIDYTWIIGGNSGRFTITTLGGLQEYMPIEQVKFYKKTRNGVASFYEIAQLKPGKPKTYRPMALLASGRITLLTEDDENGNSFFVTGEGFNDYVTKERNFEELKERMKVCEAFAERFKRRSDQQFKYLNRMVQFYNRSCPL